MKIFVQTDIKKPIILVYELLIRLVFIALDIRTNRPDQDGESILKLVNFFVAKINDTNLLEVKFLFVFKNPSNLSKSLSSDTHQKWLRFLQATVKATKALHSNSEALNETLSYFSNATESITMHIIAELDPHTVKDDLHTRLLKTTFRNVQKKIIQKANTNKVVNALQKLKISETTLIINSIEDNELSEFSSEGKRLNKKARLIKLYKCLEYAQKLKEVVDNFNLLNIVGGWILILADVLDIHVLAGHIQKHSKDCAELLQYDSESKIFDKQVQKGLKTYDRSGVVLNLSQQVFNDLKELISSERRANIGNFAIKSF